MISFLMMDGFLVGFGLIAVGTTVFVLATRRPSLFFRGNYVQEASGNVIQTFNERHPASQEGKTATETQLAKKEYRFIAWAGLIMAIAGVLISFAKLIIG